MTLEGVTNRNSAFYHVTNCRSFFSQKMKRAARKSESEAHGKSCARCAYFKVFKLFCFVLFLFFSTRVLDYAEKQGLLVVLNNEKWLILPRFIHENCHFSITVQTLVFSVDPDRCEQIITWYSRPKFLVHLSTSTSC